MDVLLMGIKDVPGTSRLNGHVGHVELLAFSHGVAKEDGGRTPGRPRHQVVTVTKYLDDASPALNQKCCEGAELGDVTVTVGRNDDGRVVPHIVYTLSNGMITSISIGGGGGSKPVEELTIEYSALRWTFQSQQPSGDEAGGVSGGWDLAANAPL